MLCCNFPLIPHIDTETTENTENESVLTLNRYFNRLVDNVMNPDQSKALNDTNYNSVRSVISVSIRQSSLKAWVMEMKLKSRRVTSVRNTVIVFYRA